jgi:hypothetical protein
VVCTVQVNPCNSVGQCISHLTQACFILLPVCAVVTYFKSLSNTLKKLAGGGGGGSQKQPPTTGARFKPGSFLMWISLAKQDFTELLQTPSTSEMSAVNKSQLVYRCGSLVLTSLLHGTFHIQLLRPLATSLTLRSMLSGRQTGWRNAERRNVGIPPLCDTTSQQWALSLWRRILKLGRIIKINVNPLGNDEEPNNCEGFRSFVLKQNYIKILCPSVYKFLLVWPLIPNQFRCRGLLLHLITHTHHTHAQNTHTHTHTLTH